MEKTIHTHEYQVLVRLLRKARQDADVTQVELAAELGQTQSFISKIELGESRLDLIQLRAILTALDISLVDFVVTFERELSREPS